jgi:hypothetical protein
MNNKCNWYVGPEVHITVAIWIVFWVVTLSRLVGAYRRFERPVASFFRIELEGSRLTLTVTLVLNKEV